MRRVLGSFAAVLTMMMTVAAVGAPAQADVRAGYADDDGVVVTVTGATLIGGEVVSVTVTATRTVDGVREPVTCNVLRVSISPDLVESFVGGGVSTFDLSLTTQVVGKRTPTVITATCEYTPLGAGSGTASASNVITLLPLARDRRRGFGHSAAHRYRSRSVARGGGRTARGGRSSARGAATPGLTGPGPACRATVVTDLLD